MIIGILKEIMPNERRVSATPDIVKQYVANDFTVMVQVGAGVGSHFSDQEYEEAGAILVEDPQELYNKVDIVLKVKEPQFNHDKNLHEIDMMHKGQFLIAFIHPASPSNHTMVQRMAERGIIGFTLDGVPRIPRALPMDPLTSMSICAGYKGMLMAFDSLDKFSPEINSPIGVMENSKVLVIGAGVGGLEAIDVAKRMGATVYAADVNPVSCEKARDKGAIIVPSDIGSEILKEVDIIFLAALVFNKKAPILLTEEQVNTMKPGSVIVDISIDQGGNCACTVPGEVVVRNGVTINGIKNIPGRIPTSSTWMFSKNLYNFVSYLTHSGEISMDLSDEVVASTLVTDGSKIIHKGTLEALGK